MVLTKQMNVDPSKKTLPEMLRGVEILASQYAVTRGFFGALLLGGILAGAIPVFEIFRPIHALFVGWNDAMSAVGRLIANIPIVPELSAELINTVLFIATVTIPGIIGLCVDSYRNERLRERLKRDLVGVCFSAIGVLSISYIFIFGPILFQGASIDRAREFTQVASGNSGVPFSLSLPLVVSLYSLTILVPFFFALALKGYRKGVLLLIGVILAIEIGYFAPYVGDWLRDKSDAVLCTEVARDRYCP